jgi:hypothetical protein
MDASTVLWTREGERLTRRDAWSAAKSPLLNNVWGYWRGLVDRHGGVPPKSAMDPAGFTRALPYVWLYERIGDGYLCRLAGEEIRRTYRGNPAGRMMNALMVHAHYDNVKAHFDAVLDGPAVGGSVGKVYLLGHEKHGVGERLMLPFGDDTGTPRFLLGVTWFELLKEEGASRLNDFEIGDGIVVERWIVPIDRI